MTADIAHDLRNPLTVIGGYVESMRDGVLEPTPERWDAVQAEVKHLERLVDDLRTLSQAEAGELGLNREPVAPAQLLEQMQRSYGPLAAKQAIALRLDVQPDLPTVTIDPDRMAQVLGNLISNSLRYTPAQGEIVLAAQREDASVILSVRDNGQGIAPDALPSIFDRFYRARFNPVPLPMSPAWAWPLPSPSSKPTAAPSPPKAPPAAAPPSPSSCPSNFLCQSRKMKGWAFLAGRERSRAADDRIVHCR